MAAKMPKDAQEKIKWLTDMVTERDQEIGGLEKRLETAFQNVRELEAKAEKDEEAWKKDKRELERKIELLENEVKHERRRATQALDVAESTSNATYGIGRLIHTLVDENVLEQLRISNQERKERAKESMRHRRPG